MVAFSYCIRRSFSVSVQKQTQGLKVLFFGTSEFSVPTLEVLYEESVKENGSISHIEACCPLMKKLIPPVRRKCEELSVQIHSYPLKPEDCQRFDLGVVSSFGHLLPSKIIESFPMGMLNVHGSLLPKYRGAAPIPYAILNGDSRTGITIMEVKPYHFDIGGILATKECKIDQDETTSQLSTRMSHIGANLMLEVIKNYSHFKKNMISQPTDGVTYAPKIIKSTFEIAWNSKTNWEVYNQFRALGEISKLYSFWEKSNTIIRFDKALSPRVLSDFNLDQTYPDAVPGKVISVKHKSDRFICVKCANGWIAFENFYLGAKKCMTTQDFYSGYIAKDKKGSHKFVSSK